MARNMLSGVLGFWHLATAGSHARSPRLLRARNVIFKLALDGSNIYTSDEFATKAAGT